MVLAQKQTHRSMKQNREPRNEPTVIEPIYDKGGKYIQCRKTFFMISDVRKTVQLYAKESNWTTLSHLYKNKLKMD